MEPDNRILPAVASLRPALQAITDRLHLAVDELSTQQLHWRPPDGGWSIGQVLEHLALVHEPYLARMQAALERGRERALRGPRRWRPTLLGGLLLRSLAAPMKVKTRRRFDPGPAAGEGAAGRFLATVRGLDAMVEAAEGADLRVRFASPVAAAFRPNLGEAFVILTLHARRHLAQIERVLAHPAFPGR